MSQENLKEVEIITQRIEEKFQLQNDDNERKSEEQSNPNNQQNLNVQDIHKKRLSSGHDGSQGSYEQGDDDDKQDKRSSGDRQTQQPRDSQQLNEQLLKQPLNGETNNRKSILKTDPSQNLESGKQPNNQAELDKQKEEEEENDIFKIEDKKPVIKYPKILEFLDGSKFQIFVTAFTFYALFADDIRVMATTKPADIYFDVFTIIALVTFIVEIVLAVLSKEDYLFGFFFWLDTISTISLILDIQSVSQAIFYSGAASQTAQLAKAGKASRVGTRAGRIVRLVRLIRIVKLYKAASSEEKVDEDVDLALQKYMERKKKVHPSGRGTMFGIKPIDQSMLGDQSRVEDGNISQLQNQGQPFQSQLQIQQDQQQLQLQNDQSQIQQPRLSQQDPIALSSKRISQIQQDSKSKKGPATPIKESRVSKRLSDLTTKRVIIIVLVLLFIMPLFSSDYYFDSPTAVDFAMYNARAMSQTTATMTQLYAFFEYLIEIHGSDYINSPMVYFNSPFDDATFQASNYDTLRHDEKQLSTYTIDLDLYKQTHANETALYDKLKAIQDVSPDDERLQFYSALNIRSSNIITAGLSLGRTIFVCIVLTLGAIAFTNDANDLALGPIERMITKVNKIARNPISAKEQELVKEDGQGDQYETVIIENAIIKIGSLLALGFGDAGSEIIGSNMAKNGDVDPMIPGKKKCAIYGFCDIRNFTDATEQLQEDVMLFVNNIGEVVHSVVDRFQGAANKNIGDAFLMVWKIDKKYYEIREEDNHITYKDERYISILSDYAVLSFMKIQAKLNREKKLLDYRTDQRLLSRMPGYKVKMGYGLHIGWGIEGAIGSEFKIDASYLSPNVNMASKLEEKSKQYGTPLLISEALHTCCTPEMKRYLRQVDKIKEKGISPFGLFTVDMKVDNLEPSKDPAVYEADQHSKKARKELERLKKLDMLEYLDYQETNAVWNAQEFIENNKDLRLIMDGWDEQFISIYNEGFTHYIAGEWQSAKSKFDQCKKTHPDDGPINNLMEVMGATNFKAPPDWPGYKEY